MVRDLCWRAAFAIKRKLALRHPADVGTADGQSGLPFGAALARAHRGIGLGVCGLARTTPTRAALPGPPWQFPRVDDRRVQKTLTWPWWSSVAPSLDSLSLAFPDGPCSYQILSRKWVFLTCR